MVVGDECARAAQSECAGVFESASVRLSLIFSLIFSGRNWCYHKLNKKVSHPFHFDLVLCLICATQVIRIFGIFFSIFWQRLLNFFKFVNTSADHQFSSASWNSFLAFTVGSICTESVSCSNSKVSRIPTRDFLYVTTTSKWVFKSRIQQLPSICLSWVFAAHNPLESWKKSIGVTIPS